MDESIMFKKKTKLLLFDLTSFIIRNKKTFSCRFSLDALQTGGKGKTGQLHRVVLTRWKPA